MLQKYFLATIYRTYVSLCFVYKSKYQYTAEKLASIVFKFARSFDCKINLFLCLIHGFWILLKQPVLVSIFNPSWVFCRDWVWLGIPSYVQTCLNLSRGDFSQSTKLNIVQNERLIKFQGSAKFFIVQNFKL